jgi:hypothetical protein
MILSVALILRRQALQLLGSPFLRLWKAEISWQRITHHVSILLLHVIDVITASKKFGRFVTPRFKYLRNYLTDRPFMQPSYKDPWPVSIRFRRMMANNEMNETQLIFFGPDKPPEELYDLENDPHEIHNLAEDPAFQKELEEHRTMLKDWIAETGDQGQDNRERCWFTCSVEALGRQMREPGI